MKFERVGPREGKGAVRRNSYKITIQISVFQNLFLGHPNNMFRFPSPSDSNGLVGRSEKKKLKLKILFQSNTIPLN